MKAHHLRYLVRYHERGNTLETDQDIPNELLTQIETEEERQKINKRSQNGTATVNIPAIQVVMPGNTSSDPGAERLATTTRRIDLPGFHDVNLQKYCDWLKGRVQSNSSKADYQKATDFLIDYGFALDLLCDEPKPELLIDEAQVKVGNALRYMKDIPVYIDILETQTAHIG